eukprot:CAMPEP_0183355500 /NCGR_PEP_ID=MMETSP0164_2-20130417/40674_1 /TAXON_ID=221442 /ORGANISM="Coccolithus pelagicus ssp braarudi, Strain PLY182g" /LENGTH=246 /DNA_ID=CAMNT_0025528627 /DNA_START=42 /DNA_END=785 /DNA_ORIENTATION=-
MALAQAQARALALALAPPSCVHHYECVNSCNATTLEENACSAGCGYRSGQNLSECAKSCNAQGIFPDTKACMEGCSIKCPSAPDARPSSTCDPEVNQELCSDECDDMDWMACQPGCEARQGATWDECAHFCKSAFDNDFAFRTADLAAHIFARAEDVRTLPVGSAAADRKRPHLNMFIPLAALVQLVHAPSMCGLGHMHSMVRRVCFYGYLLNLNFNQVHAGDGIKGCDEGDSDVLFGPQHQQKTI